MNLPPIGSGGPDDVVVEIDDGDALYRLAARSAHWTGELARTSAVPTDVIRAAVTRDGIRGRTGDRAGAVETRFTSLAATPAGRMGATTLGDGRTLTGYAAVFNSWTDIDSTEGRFREQVAPGAFARSLVERQPVIQFDHGRHPTIGSIPLGAFEELTEDRHGLHVRARLSDNWLIEPVRDAIRDGAITGMSFKFSVRLDKWQLGSDGVHERTLLDVDLYEAGPVVHAAYLTTTVGVQ